MKPPRSGDDALALAAGVSPQYAAQLRRRLGAGEEFAELDAQLRAESALADVDAARSIDAEDIADAALDADPIAALSETVAGRSERELRARLAAHMSWAKTDDRTARTAPARAAMDKKFLDEAGGDQQKADSLRKAYYTRLALKSAQARRKSKS